MWLGDNFKNYDKLKIRVYVDGDEELSPVDSDEHDGCPVVADTGRSNKADSGESQTHKRPNILFILADDQSPFDLKMYNPDSILDTPVLDRLASEGMVFDGAYHMGAWAGGVCTPSRHMIMSGRGVWHIPDKPGFGRNPQEKDVTKVPADLAENTLAALFNRAGYTTMRTCKQGNSYEAANKKFAVRHDRVKRGGTDETGSAWHGEQVLNYLKGREADQDTRPFMIYYGFSHPHDPRNGKVDL
ncbi:MAG: sulfatase-like hydrolase/transferase, partial [Planctomycetes bacterium]|nr:sulfatase-like hydrolase/transferase [Planctomycetota bacterium]